MITNLLRVETNHVLDNVLFEIGSGCEHFDELSSRQLEQYLMRNELDALTAFYKALPHLRILPNLNLETQKQQ